MDQLSHLQPTLQHAALQYHHSDHMPGAVIHAAVLERHEHGTAFTADGHRFLIPTELLASLDTETIPPPGASQVIAVLAKSDPVTGYRHATRRGAAFIAGVFDTYLPNALSGAWVGASSSWGVVRMPDKIISHCLEAGGVKIRALQAIVGLKRLSLIPDGEGDTPEEREADCLRHCLGVVWPEAKILAHRGRDATLILRNHNYTRAKAALIAKIFPDTRFTYR